MNQWDLIYMLTVAMGCHTQLLQQRKLTLNSLHFLGFKPVVTTLGTEAMIVLHAHPNNGLPCEMCFLACSEKSSFKLLYQFLPFFN